MEQQRNNESINDIIDDTNLHELFYLFNKEIQIFPILLVIRFENDFF
jgi:hypothetical protein